MTTVVGETRSSSVAFFSGPSFAAASPTFSRGDNGVLKVTGMPIFRSGSFMDSEGWPHEYDDVHMQMIASNFTLLKDRGIFTDPPVRCGHPQPFVNSMRDLIGSVTGLSVAQLTSPADSQTYSYILADFEIGDKDAADKIESGVWKHRSAEIGMYTTNSGMEFYPTLVGFAYVDIPAVEGLNFNHFSKPQNLRLIDSDQREQNMPEAKATQASGQDSGTQEGGSGVPAPASVETFAAAPPAPFTFRVAGQEVTDYGAVQAHINELEQFQSETIRLGRETFIDSLAASKRILQTQVPGMKELAKTYSVAQWEQFKALYETAQPLPLLGEHVVSAGGTPESTPPTTPEDQAVAQAKRVVERHRLAGISLEQIKATPSGLLLLSKNIPII